MKRTLILLVTLILTLSMTLSLASCGKNEKRDISGAKSLADLKGAKISAQSGTFHETARLQIEDVQGSVYEDFDAMLIALKSGAIDGYIAEEPTALAVCGKDSSLGYIKPQNNSTGFTATDADVAIAIGCKTGSPLVAQINSVLSTLTEAQRKTLMEQIVVINGGGTVAEFAVSNVAPANPTGTLKVAMECAYDPFNWTQTNDANGAVVIAGTNGSLYANGYDVQIAKYVANALGLRLEIHKAEWKSLIPGINAGTYDVIIAGMSPTAEREEKIDFTQIYYSSNLVVIYKKN